MHILNCLHFVQNFWDRLLLCVLACLLPQREITLLPQYLDQSQLAGPVNISYSLGLQGCVYQRLRMHRLFPYNLATVYIYQPRNPKASAYYECVKSHFEELEKTWDDMYASRYGFWRTYVMTVIYKYLDCGDLHFRFARVSCEECGHEYFLAFSCKRRQFCPSCHQKRVVEYGEWLLTNVLKDVSHRQ